MAKKKQSGGTPATVALDRAGVRYAVRSYEHDPAAQSYGLEAASALGVDPERVFKTLLVQAEEVEQGGVEVVDVDRVLDDVPAQFVGLADHLAPLDPAPGEEHAEAEARRQTQQEVYVSQTSHTLRGDVKHDTTPAAATL